MAEHHEHPATRNGSPRPAPRATVHSITPVPSEQPEPAPTDRRRWVVALATQPRQDLLALAEPLAERYHATPKRVPKAGLAMLTLRDSVYQEAFNLGELPLSVAHVALTAPDGRTVEGAAQIMADDAPLATALAVLSGVLDHQLEGWRRVRVLLEDGLAVLDHRARVRQGMLERTRVDFDVLAGNETAGDSE